MNTISIADAKARLSANFTPPISDGVYLFNSYDPSNPIKFGKASAYPVTLLNSDGVEHGTLDIPFLNGTVKETDKNLLESVEDAIVELKKNPKMKLKTFEFQFPTSEFAISLSPLVDSSTGKQKLSSKGNPIFNIIFDNISIEDCIAVI